MTNLQKGIWSFYNSRHDQSTMGIDPMNNISNNNKNTLCSYIISTIIILPIQSYISLSFQAISRHNYCGCYKILIAVVNNYIAAILYELMYFSRGSWSYEALTSFCTWKLPLFSICCFVMGRYTLFTFLLHLYKTQRTFDLSDL
jgi:Na+-translocating ferredoxin:NAD+ oxidoreductase RnfE subunit